MIPLKINGILLSSTETQMVHCKLNVAPYLPLSYKHINNTVIVHMCLLLIQRHNKLHVKCQESSVVSVNHDVFHKFYSFHRKMLFSLGRILTLLLLLLLG